MAESSPSSPHYEAGGSLRRLHDICLCCEVRMFDFDELDELDPAEEETQQAVDTYAGRDDEPPLPEAKEPLPAVVQPDPDEEEPEVMDAPLPPGPRASQPCSAPAPAPAARPPPAAAPAGPPPPSPLAQAPPALVPGTLAPPMPVVSEEPAPVEGRDVEVHVDFAHRGERWAHDFRVAKGTTILGLKRKMTAAAPDQASWFELRRGGRCVPDTEAIMSHARLDFVFLGAPR